MRMTLNIDADMLEQAMALAPGKTKTEVIVEAVARSRETGDLGLPRLARF